MLDKFLNRRAVEERQKLHETIEKLEKENNNLRKRLSKRETKVAEDPAKRQELEESLNKAFTKINVLEHELEVCRNRKIDNNVRSFESVRLPQKESLDFMKRVSSVRTENDDLLTVYCSPDDTEIISQVQLPEISDILSDIVTEKGFVIFYDRGYNLSPLFAVIPPFPVESSFSTYGRSFDTNNLSTYFSSKGVAAFVLAHAGQSFIGVSDAENLLYGELVTTGVKEKHSKGGWSQRRFERLRDEDIHHHTEKAGDAFTSMMEFQGSIAEYIVLMGDHKLAEAITKGCNLKRLLKTTDIKPDRHCGDSLRKEIWSFVWFKF